MEFGCCGVVGSATQGKGGKEEMYGVVALEVEAGDDEELRRSNWEGQGSCQQHRKATPQ